MDIKRRTAAHNKRWGIQSLGVDVKGFKQRLERFLFEYVNLEGDDQDSFPDNIERDFSIIAGVPWYSGGVIHRIKSASSLGECVTALQQLFWALEENKSALAKPVVQA